MLKIYSLLSATMDSITNNEVLKSEKSDNFWIVQENIFDDKLLIKYWD